MNEPLRCPDCGAENAPDSVACSQCNFPFRPQPFEGADEKKRARPAEPEASAPAQSATREPVPSPPPIRRRPARPRRGDPMSLSLWLFFGGFCVLVLVYVAVSANLERGRAPVEGASDEQAKLAEEIRSALDRDSTNIEAHQALADLLYDTHNWSEAIVHYRAVLARDSARVTALVDLGVCYYNLGHFTDAERLFNAAIRHDPHQPVAFFNLGILSERREQFEAAQRFYHSALQSDPPEKMRTPLMEAIARVQQLTGSTPAPLPDGRK